MGPKRMKVLVTGGAGYIGSVVAEELLQAGHQVVVFDNLSRGHREAVPKNAELIVGELADRDHLDQVFRLRAIDAVMHFAALIEAGESMKAPEEFFRNNTANALTLLEAMLAAGVKHFVFSSTAALYGNPERTPIAEDDPLRPTNAYGESKLLVERMLAWFHQIHGLRYASLRYFNAAGASGPGQGEAHQPETHLIPRILEVALGRAEHVNIFGDRLPNARRHLRPRLHPRQRSGARAPVGPRSVGRCAGEFQSAHLQPGQRAGLQRAPGSRSGAEGHRASDSGDRIAAPRRRSSRVDCQLGKNSPRPGLAAEIPGFENHCGKRVAVASRAS